MGAGIAIAFLLSGADDIAGNSTVDTGLFECLEGFFYETIFTGMEGKNRDAGTRLKYPRKLFEKFIEDGELLVYFDAKRLEHTGK